MLELHYTQRGKKITCIITEYKDKECKTLFHASVDIEDALKFLCDTKEIYLKFLEEQYHAD